MDGEQTLEGQQSIDGQKSMGRRCYLQSCAAHLVDDGQDPGGRLSLEEQKSSKGQKSVEGQKSMGRRCYLQSCAAHLIDDGQDPEGQADALLAAVLHQLKLTIRGHKADHLLCVKAPQVDTLVEGHILQGRQAGFGDIDFTQGHVGRPQEGLALKQGLP